MRVVVILMLSVSLFTIGCNKKDKSITSDTSTLQQQNKISVGKFEGQIYKQHNDVINETLIVSKKDDSDKYLVEIRGYKVYCNIENVTDSNRDSKGIFNNFNDHKSTYVGEIIWGTSGVVKGEPDSSHVSVVNLMIKPSGNDVELYYLEHKNYNDEEPGETFTCNFDDKPSKLFKRVK